MHSGVSIMSETKRYIVEFYGVSDPEIVEAAGGTVRHNFSSISEKLSAMLSDEVREQLLLNPSIKGIEEVKRTTGSAQTMSWEYTYTQVAARYRGTYTGSGVKVAIVDTGVATHPDLPNVVAFKDYIGTETAQYDDHGHGTFIAGLIAAQDNTIGYVGTAPGVSLYGCKVLDSDNRGYADDHVAGIEWAVAQGVNIINFSIYMDDPNETTVRDACRAAYNAGIIVVACSGNGTLNDDVALATVGTPANDYSCVGVGSINSSGNRSSFSNYGTGLDLVAPGDTVISTNNIGTYWQWHGTSFATAVVTGHLAILKEKYPSYSRQQLVEKLLALCYELGSSWEYGAGCIMAETNSATATTYVSTPTAHGCRWSIYDLGSVWDDGNYLQCCLSTYASHPSGSSAEPPNILDRQWPPTSGSVNHTPSQDFSTGLNSNSAYNLYGYAKAANGLWYPAGSDQIVTAKEPLDTPYLDAYGSTIRTITLSMAPVAYANKYYAICNGIYLNNTTGDFTWNGLNPDTDYQIEYYVSNTYGYFLDSAHVYGSIRTLAAIRPALFDWSYVGCDASGTPVAGTTKSSNYQLYVTAIEWNFLVQNIIDVWEYKGWNNPGLGFAVQGNDMLASQFNAVKKAIDIRNSTGIADKTADTSNVLYSDFNTLREKLNGIT